MSERGNELKGSVFTMSVLHLEDASSEKIKQLLDNKAKQAPKFFDSAPLVVNVENLNEVPDFNKIMNAVISANFIPVGVTGIKTQEIRAAAREVGLAILTSGKEISADQVVLHTPKEKIYKTPSELRESTAEPEQPKVEQIAVNSDQSTTTKVIQGTVRSGQQIYSAGPIVILGSVSNGAEIISNDSIHVYGNLRGRALAGARGNSDARIFCGKLEAELISIAGHYLPSESLPANYVGQEVQIKLESEKIIFDKLTS